MKLNEHTPQSSSTTETLVTHERMAHSHIFCSDDVKEIPDVQFPARMENILIVLVTKGNASISINLKEYSLKPGSLLVIIPNSIVLKREGSDDFAAHYLLVGSEQAEEVSFSTKGRYNNFIYLHEHPVTLLDERESHLLEEYYRFVKQRISNADDPFQSLIMHHLTASLLFEIMRIIYRYHPEKEVAPNRQQEIFSRFLSLLKEHYKGHHPVSFYADKLCITPKYLSALSKNLTGETAGEWVDRCIIAEAKRMLRTSNLSIQEISNQLNFPNQSFFGKYFKRHTGVSPKEFRKES